VHPGHMLTRPKEEEEEEEEEEHTQWGWHSLRLIAECYLLQAISVSHTSDVHKLRCGHPTYTVFNGGLISNKLEMMWKVVTVVCLTLDNILVFVWWDCRIPQNLSARIAGPRKQLQKWGPPRWYSTVSYLVSDIKTERTLSRPISQYHSNKWLTGSTKIMTVFQDMSLSDIIRSVGCAWLFV
jgi:hypothetical protein